MTQSQWMKGCPEGGEQGFLFSLYSQLVEGQCPCPSGCGYSVARDKSHFFAIFVSNIPSSLLGLHYPFASPLSRCISSSWEELSARRARDVPRCSALHAASQLMDRKFQNQQMPRMTAISSIAPICKASFSALVLRCSNSCTMTNFRIRFSLRTRPERPSVERQTQ